jgi:EAL domain-containing protein (putative c-di-GMP-specific phosphodiesterase class I)
MPDAGEVVVEGVESQSFLDGLALLVCNAAQEYLVAVPMPANQLRSWSEEWPGKCAAFAE